MVDNISARVLVDFDDALNETLVDPVALAGDLPANLRAAIDLDETLARIASLEAAVGSPARIGRYQVQKNGALCSPEGEAFTVRGVIMFDTCFVSYETRSDYRYRSPSYDFLTVSPLPDEEESHPTYRAHVSYVSDARAEQDILAAKAIGVNYIRVAVEPAMMFQKKTYSINGTTFPNDVDLLDRIVSLAGKYNMVIQLQNGNDRAPLALNVSFLAFLAEKYADNPNVWINPANEINCADGSANCNNPAVWFTEMKHYMQALRAEYNGKRFLNPVSIQATHYGYYVNDIAAYLDSDPVFYDDPNLIISPHFYSLEAAGIPFQKHKTYLHDYWAKYLGKYCIMLDEVGFTASYDVVSPGEGLGNWPGVGYPYSTTEQVTARRLYMREALDYFRQLENETNFAGACMFTWCWYAPESNLHDLNTMRLFDGTWTTWGGIARDHWLAPKRKYRQSQGDSNFLVNDNFLVNQRSFAGGALSQGQYGYDMWAAVAGGANITKNYTTGTITLASGFIQQIIPFVDDLMGEVVTVSVEDLVAPAGYMNVYIGSSTATIYYKTAPIVPNSGRCYVHLPVPSTMTFPTGMTVTLQAPPGGAVFRGPVRLEKGYGCEVETLRLIDVELSQCERYYEISGGNEYYTAPFTDALEFLRTTRQFRTIKATVPSVSVTPVSSDITVELPGQTTTRKVIFAHDADVEGNLVTWSWVADASPTPLNA